MKIDTNKLLALISTLLAETRGCCTSSKVCIGEIDGKQIQLIVGSESDDWMVTVDKNICVTD